MRDEVLLQIGENIRLRKRVLFFSQLCNGGTEVAYGVTANVCLIVRRSAKSGELPDSDFLMDNR